METDLAEVLIEAFHLQREQAEELSEPSEWEALMELASEFDALMTATRH